MISEAEDLYRQICSFTARKLGPFILDSSGQRVPLLRIFPTLETVLNDVHVPEVIDPSERVIRFASPWHAVLWMLSLVEISSSPQSDPTLQIVDPTTVQTRRSRPLFRGQLDSSWRLVPSLERAQDPQLEIAASRIFSARLWRLLALHGFPILESTAFIGAAQHYGIATHLLDFTPDPAIAVFFACHGRRDVSNPDGAVYVLPIEDAICASARILLPPPFVRRLHTQRGVFVEAISGDASALERMSWRLIFPRDSRYRVVREGRQVDVLSTDTWLLQCASWAWGCAQAGLELSADEAEVADRVLDEANQRFAPDFVHRIPAEVSAWTAFAQEMLYWLVVELVDGEEWWNPSALDVLIRDNPAILSILLGRTVAALFARFGAQKR